MSSFLQSECCRLKAELHLKHSSLCTILSAVEQMHSTKSKVNRIQINLFVSFVERNDEFKVILVFMMLKDNLSSKIFTQKQRCIVKKTAKKSSFFNGPAKKNSPQNFWTTRAIFLPNIATLLSRTNDFAY